MQMEGGKIFRFLPRAHTLWHVLIVTPALSFRVTSVMPYTLHPEFPGVENRGEEASLYWPHVHCSHVHSLASTHGVPSGFHSFTFYISWETGNGPPLYGEDWGVGLERSKATSELWESTRSRHSWNEHQPSPHGLHLIPQEMEFRAFGELQHLIGEKPVDISDYTARDSFIPYFVADFSENGVTWAKDKTTNVWSIFTN